MNVMGLEQTLDWRTHQILIAGGSYNKCGISAPLLILLTFQTQITQHLPSFQRHKWQVQAKLSKQNKSLYRLGLFQRIPRVLRVQAQALLVVNLVGQVPQVAALQAVQVVPLDSQTEVRLHQQPNHSPWLGRYSTLYRSGIYRLHLTIQLSYWILKVKYWRLLSLPSQKLFNQKTIQLIMVIQV